MSDSCIVLVNGYATNEVLSTACECTSNPIYTILVRNNGTVEINSITEGCILKIPRAVSSLIELYDIILSNRRVEYIVVLHLRSISLPPSYLQRIIAYYNNKKADYVVGNGNGIGQRNLIVEVFGRQCIAKLQKTPYPLIDRTQLNGMILDSSFPYWPSADDVSFYLHDQYTRYYSKPKTINIEISSKCNYKCNKCMYHSVESPYRINTTEQNFMSLKTFKYIVDKIEEEFGNETQIVPTIRGECFIHPECMNMFKYLASRGFPVSTYTNGVLCTPKISNELIAMGIRWITYSIDAVDGKLYKKLHSGGCYSQVKENLEYALKIRAGKPFPFIGLNYVDGPDNEGHFSEYWNRWWPSVDYIYRSKWSDVKNQLKLYRETFDLPVRYPCLLPWRKMFVNTCGEAFICTAWLKNGYGTMSSLQYALTDIWNSEYYRIARQIQVNPKMAYDLKYCEDESSWAAPYSYTVMSDGVQAEYSKCGIAYWKRSKKV